MPNLGRLTNALFSATNEATFALANLNFDFSLVKFEAPKEFTTVGERLSNLRRNDAEDGQTHKTARRLGALFESLVPPTPELIKAYGLRASEISRQPKINPRGTKKDGPFEAYIGADGTSIWAAATSKDPTAGAHAPLAMHLLACMLARFWDMDKATSIWVELVNTRQNEIPTRIDDEPQHIQALMAVRQEITREQLAAWDASARSWLRSADEANVSKNTQLMLILKNVSVPVSQGSSTYESVVAAWRHAMMGMENLIKGAYQEASEGSILLALSAWHIYPDLIVLGGSTRNVRFSDPLVRKGGALTIGLQFISPERTTGMQWSLTLSHLLYYGDAIKVNDKDDSTRVTMSQLLLVALGALFSCWQVRRDEEMVVASYLSCLWDFLVSDEDILTARGSLEISLRFRWLHVLVKAAEFFTSSQKADPETCKALINRGRRRGKRFIATEDTPSLSHSHLFGLDNPTIIEMLKAPGHYEGIVSFYREVAKNMGLAEGDALIRVSHKRNDVEYFEYATAIPHSKASLKRSSDGSSRMEHVHCRWLLADPRSYHAQKNSKWNVKERYKRCKCFLCDGNCPCESLGGICHPDCHPATECRRCQQYPINWHRRQSELQQLGEACKLLNTRDMTNSAVWLGAQQMDGLHGFKVQCMGDIFVWLHPPPLYRFDNAQPESATNGLSSCTDSSTCMCLEFHGHSSSSFKEATFKAVHGKVEGIALFVRVSPRIPACLHGKNEAQISSFVMDSVRARFSLENAIKSLKSGNINRSLFAEYLRYISEFDEEVSMKKLSHTAQSDFRIICRSYALPEPFLKAVEGLDLASEIYERLEGSTVSLRVTDLPLHRSMWLKSLWEKHYLSTPIFPNAPNMRINDTPFHNRLQNFKNLTRSQRLACIAMFESGTIDLNPDNLDQVIAFASANSIFVASELLSDPVDLSSNQAQVRRVVGNIGRPGMAFLVLPQLAPRIRSLRNELCVVPYLDYDFKREDNYSGTSLHLSFTHWKRSLNPNIRGAMDEGAYLVEAFLSVHDRGVWVADLDVSMIKGMPSESWEFKCICDSCGDPDTLTSLDQWEELLDSPDNIGVVRARGNWVARLAATAIRFQQGKGSQTFVVPNGCDPCFKCLPARFASEMGDVLRVIID